MALNSRSCGGSNLFLQRRITASKICTLRYVDQDCSRSLLSMFKLFKPEFEAIFLSVRKLPLFESILKKWVHFFSAGKQGMKRHRSKPLFRMCLWITVFKKNLCHDFRMTI